jgi:hypothetical protein
LIEKVLFLSGKAKESSFNSKRLFAVDIVAFVVENKALLWSF